ncbi:MAG: hypothetical protein ABIT37_10035 [Luteolibacter sp.]
MDAVRKLYISLIVHEKPEVILNQLRNFRHFAPAATIVLHVSKAMDLTPDLLREIEALGQIHVNPVRVGTSIHSLQGPHHENLRFVFSLNPAETDVVAFHASNDMLVRKGVENYIQSCDAAYYHDGILNPSTDPIGAAKILGDEEFTALRSQAGAEVVIYSQVEGTFYQIKHLLRAFNLIDKAGMDLTKSRPYFAEEIILPTLIHGFLKNSGQSVGMPYVLSELSFIVKYFEIANKLFGHGIAAKVFCRLLRMVGPTRVSPRLVDGIRNGDIGSYEKFRKSNGVVRFNTRDSYGVKRVLREIDDPLRRHISALE